MLDEPWYSKGLRFQCTQCGDCCTGAPGYVWVSKEEIAQLAAEVELDVAEFEQKYVRAIGVRKSLVEYSNGDCVFFDGESRKCSVYASRPRQCRTWPFWESNTRSPEHWHDTCQVCPGSGQGKLYKLEEIEQRVNEFRV